MALLVETRSGKQLGGLLGFIKIKEQVVAITNVKTTDGNSNTGIDQKTDPARSPFRLRGGIGPSFIVSDNSLSRVGGSVMAGLSVVSRSKFCFDASAHFNASAGKLFYQLLIKNPDGSETKTPDSSTFPTLGGGGILAGGYCGDPFSIFFGPQVTYEDSAGQVHGPKYDLGPKKIATWLLGVGLGVKLDLGRGFFLGGNYLWGRPVDASAVSEGKPRAFPLNYSFDPKPPVDYHEFRVLFGGEIRFGNPHKDTPQVEPAPTIRPPTPPTPVQPPQPPPPQPPLPPPPPPPGKIPPEDRCAKSGDPSVDFYPSVSQTDSSGNGMVSVTAQNHSLPNAGKIISYQWEYANSSSGSWKLMGSSSSASITVPVGTYRIKLVVKTDCQKEQTVIHNVEIKARVKDKPPAENQIPVAKIVVDPPPLIADKSRRKKVSISGEQSFDPDGHITDYRWTVDGRERSSGQSSFSDYFRVGKKHLVTLRVLDDRGGISQTVQASFEIDPAPCDLKKLNYLKKRLEHLKEDRRKTHELLDQKITEAEKVKAGKYVDTRENRRAYEALKEDIRTLEKADNDLFDTIQKYCERIAELKEKILRDKAAKVCSVDTKKLDVGNYCPPEKVDEPYQFTEFPSTEACEKINKLRTGIKIAVLKAWDALIEAKRLGKQSNELREGYTNLKEPTNSSRCFHPVLWILTKVPSIGKTIEETLCYSKDDRQTYESYKRNLLETWGRVDRDLRLNLLTIQAQESIALRLRREISAEMVKVTKGGKYNECKDTSIDPEDRVLNDNLDSCKREREGFSSFAEKVCEISDRMSEEKAKMKIWIPKFLTGNEDSIPRDGIPRVFGMKNRKSSGKRHR